MVVFVSIVSPQESRTGTSSTLLRCGDDWEGRKSRKGAFCYTVQFGRHCARSGDFVGPTTLCIQCGVFDAVFMNTTQTSDAELEDRVRLELKWAPGLDQTHIGIAVADGSVTLSGGVADFSQIELAERAAWKVAGVVAVAQDIGIASDSLPVSDTDIAHDLALALAETTEIPAGAVHSTVTRGCVFLGGTVSWDFQRAAAEHAAASVQGVRRVRNSIEVSPSVAAEHISRHIEAVLEREIAEELHRISISADGAGHVVLAGTARSVAECNAIGRAAHGADGVETVRNLVHVTG